MIAALGYLTVQVSNTSSLTGSFVTLASARALSPAARPTARSRLAAVGPHDRPRPRVAEIDEDARAFEQLVRRHQPTVRAALRRAGIGSSDVDDLCQQTFITAHRRRGCLGPESSVTAWLASIARLVACNHRRGERRRRLRLAQYRTLSRERSDDGVRWHDGMDLRRMVDRLPSAKREVVRLRMVEGCSVRETAERLGITRHTVRSRLAGAQTLLQRLADPVPRRVRPRPIDVSEARDLGCL
ncbi:MAG: sigma-70 family RNA polymerase sigma factor [Myxococcales bacterium FL481]|nr:MAG: sigma-70 family RNA polymerase sigma factor [Myxococcales bacterium FL481]